MKLNYLIQSSLLLVLLCGAANAEDPNKNCRTLNVTYAPRTDYWVNVKYENCHSGQTTIERAETTQGNKGKFDVLVGSTIKIWPTTASESSKPLLTDPMNSSLIVQCSGTLWMDGSSKCVTQ